MESAMNITLGQQFGNISKRAQLKVEYQNLLLTIEGRSSFDDLSPYRAELVINNTPGGVE
jgi:hypothetical protein